MTDEQIIEFLMDNLEYFKTNDLVTGILRQIGWLIVKGFNSLLDACSALYDNTFGLVDITRWSVLEDFIREYEPLVQAILVATLVILGFMFILGKNKKHNLITSALIFAVVFTSSSYLFSTFNSFAVLFKGAVVGSEGAADGYNLVNQNLYDLVYIDEQIGLRNISGSPPQYPEITEQDMDMIDITETVSNEKEGLTDDAKDILGKRLEYGNIESELVDVYNGVAWTDFANTYYYRYHFNYWTYYLTAVAAIVVFLGLSYKNVRIIYELFVSRILITLFSADLSSSRKAVRILESIRDGYYALCFTAITLRSYFLFTDFITSRGSLGDLTRGIILLLLAFCVVDGANIMEKITGVDAGLSSMAGKLIAGMHMVRGATMAVQQARQMGMMKKQTDAMQKIAAGQNQSPGNMNQPPGNPGGAAGSQPGQDGSDPSGQGGSGSGPDPSGQGSNTAGGNSQADSNAYSDSQSENTNDTENNMESSVDSMNEQNDSSEYSETDTADGSESVPGEASGESDPGMSKADENFRQMDDAIDGTAENTPDREEPAGATMQKDGTPGMFERWQQKADQTGQNESHSNLPEKTEKPGNAGRDNAGMMGHHEGTRNMDPLHDAGRQESHSNASGDSTGRTAQSSQGSSRQGGTGKERQSGQHRNKEARGNRKKFEPDRTDRRE